MRNSPGWVEDHVTLFIVIPVLAAVVCYFLAQSVSWF